VSIKTGKHQLFQKILWIVFYLAVMDIAVNIIFPFPMDPARTHPSFLQEFFEYGRSVEGKLDKMMRLAEAQPVPILGYGWLKNKHYEKLPKKAGENQTLLAIYGMSHAKLLGEAIAQVDKTYVIRNITAPGAPANWSFAAHETDRNHHEAKIVILAVMTDNVQYVSATTGTTSYFDLGHPYTFPRYFMYKGQLKQINPPFCSAEGFREYFYDSRKWADYRNWLAKNDRFYDVFLFKRSLSDKSALLRVLRRAYAEKIKEKLTSHVYKKDGFNLDCEEVVALEGMVKTFAQSAREGGRIPVVYIVNNQSRGERLYRALKPVLDANKIPFLSTHIICPPDNPRVFLGTNSHFIPSKDRELAQEMINIIKKELAKEGREKPLGNHLHPAISFVSFR
jgi:hypothetical protein